MGRQIGVGLYGGDILLHVHHQFVEEPCLERQYLLLGTQNLLLVFLQLLRDIALGLCQRLLAHPLGRHLVLERVPHLQIIAEHVVIAYFQR